MTQQITITVTEAKPRHSRHYRRGVLYKRQFDVTGVPIRRKGNVWTVRAADGKEYSGERKGQST